MTTQRVIFAPFDGPDQVATRGTHAVAATAVALCGFDGYCAGWNSSGSVEVSEYVSTLLGAKPSMDRRAASSVDALHRNSQRCGECVHRGLRRRV